jgi:hypothetical protein
MKRTENPELNCDEKNLLFKKTRNREKPAMQEMS